MCRLPPALVSSYTGRARDGVDVREITYGREEGSEVEGYVCDVVDGDGVFESCQGDGAGAGGWFGKDRDGGGIAFARATESIPRSR